MIRWRYLTTRLIILVALLALLRWGLGPVVDAITVSGVQSATGAKVEIGNTTVGLFPPRVLYHNVQIADPRSDKEMRDAFRADSIELVIDGNELLHRRYVVSEARMTGVHIGAARDESGHFAEVEPVEESLSDSPSMLGGLIAQANQQMVNRSKQVVDGLETTKQARQIRDRWESEYKQLVGKARQLEGQIQVVSKRARGVENPLRDWPELERTLAEAREVRNELVAVRGQIDTLPQRIQADLLRLEEARQADLAKVDQFVPGDLSTSENFGIDLIGSAVNEQIQQLRSYLDSGRKLADYTVVAPESTRQRGIAFDLDADKKPSCLIRQCEIGGVMRAQGKVYEMTGILENLTTTPELLAEPTRARLRLEGPETVRLEYVRDQRGDADIDLVTLHWPAMKVKPIRVGDPNSGGLGISGGQRELWVQLRMQGDQIEGRLVSKQTDAKLQLGIDEAYAQTAAAVALRERLSSVDRIEVDATFSGHWDDLDLKLASNLGQVFKEATQQAIAEQLGHARGQLLAEVQKTHAREIEQLQSYLSTQQNEALSLVARADKSIEQMSEKVLNEVGDADVYLGRLRTAIRGIK